jgi:hypothetical protein
VYSVEWSSADPWTFASLSYDGRLVINKVPRAEKYMILLWNFVIMRVRQERTFTQVQIHISSHTEKEVQYWVCFAKENENTKTKLAKTSNKYGRLELIVHMEQWFKVSRSKTFPHFVFLSKAPYK